MAGTLSISLQFIYSLPTQDTSTRPQCHLLQVLESRQNVDGWMTKEIDVRHTLLDLLSTTIQTMVCGFKVLVDPPDGGEEVPV